jgi:Raf kinase inhibitor-like YbhB/YbcL family protein
MKTAGNVIAITSPAFEDAQPIPKRHTEDGEDLSPALAWVYAPKGTKQWALICDDPDAPTPEPWVHWVIYSIPGEIRSLAEGVEPAPKLAELKGALQGKNSWPSGPTIGYRGPAPPKGHGVHHYHFKLYALDAALALKPELTKPELEHAMEGHVLATGELIGTYVRK